MKYLLIAFLFISCSSEKRIKRILNKHPELISIIDIDTVLSDTIYEMDTIYTKEYKDSFIINFDTIIETDRVIVERIRNKFIVNIKKDTLYRSDTIHHTRIVKVKGKVVNIKIIPNWIYFVIALCGILSVALFKK